jgi:sulfur-carrier protein adenylyltransferase/sulfurtransferase
MKPNVPEITVVELKNLLAGEKPPRLVDVREPEEWNACRIPGAELIALSQWPQLALEKLTDKEEPLLMQCHHGGRSARATAYLLGQGYTNVRNVTGGIDAWSLEIDPSVPRYE